MLSLDRHHKYPAFIKNHKVFKDFPETINVFAKIGLKNCSEDIGKGRSIVFSSKPWDIATMSMRGISSCQSWTGSEGWILVMAKSKLIGSIADPYCAIIFITNGKKTDCGNKMLSRSLVRLVVDKDSKPYLLLEQNYGSVGGIKRFKELLSKRVGGKFPVIYADKSRQYGGWCYWNGEWGYRPPNRPHSGKVIPMSDQVASLGSGNRSYRDSCVKYGRAKLPEEIFKGTK